MGFEKFPQGTRHRPTAAAHLAAAYCYRIAPTLRKGRTACVCWSLTANLLRRWVRIAETVPAICRQDALPAPQLQAAQVPSAFVPMQLPAKPAVPDTHMRTVN